MQCKVIILNCKSCDERERILNEWLAKGWRLVTVDQHIAYLVK